MYEQPHIHDFYLSVDLGMADDYTAWVIAEAPCWLPPGLPFDPSGWTPDRAGYFSVEEVSPAQARYCRSLAEYYGRPPKPELWVRHIERLRHADYGQVVARTVALLAGPPLASAHVALLVDHGGVGFGIVDWLSEAGLDPIAIGITGGNRVNAVTDREINVPKRDIVASTQAELQAGRLRISRGLEHAATLADELRSYQVKISDAGHDSYAARQGTHDDVLMATGMAVWFRGWWLHGYDQANADRQRPVELKGRVR